MKQWAVKLTLDYGLADRAHKRESNLGEWERGAVLPSQPPSPRPFPSPGGAGRLWRRSCCWWEVQAASPFFPTSEAGLPKELEKQQAAGREAFAGGMVSNEQHRAQVPSRDTSPPHPCLPSHHCHAALVFLLENLFCSDKLWVKVKLLTPRWALRYQKGWSVPLLMSQIWDSVGEKGTDSPEGAGCCVWASRALQERHSSLLCASHQHSQSSVSRTPLISTTARGGKQIENTVLPSC